MYLLSLLSLAGALALAWSSGPEPAPLTEEFHASINNAKGATWTAGPNFKPEDLGYVKSLLGVNMQREAAILRTMPTLKPKESSTKLPQTFDARVKWPNCPTIREIRDQSNCGSCWAFGTVEAISDRICVKTRKTVHISAEDLNSCCRDCVETEGCQGGSPAFAWSFYCDEGIVTGGQYGTKQGCEPYTLAPCEHHVVGPLKNCSHSIAPTPRCTRQCIPGYSKSYRDDKHRGEKSYAVQGVHTIMQEIYNHGPVTAAFTVYADFPSYKSGVYKHRSGQALGGHAVKILGWGHQNGTDYWLIANSWNIGWGDKGFFKMAKGVDECGIESGIVAGLPRE